MRTAGHQVEELGRDGGDVSNADVVLVAVPGAQISDALSKVKGLDGKLAVDATNVLPTGQGSFPSYAAEVQSFTHAPVAKGFNLNFGHLLNSVREQLMRDAGYDAVRGGDLTRARDFEDAVWLFMGIQPVGGVLYRFAAPGDL